MLTQVNLKQRSIGISFLGAEVVIRIWAPKAESLAVVIPDRGTVIGLQSVAHGYWTGSSRDIHHGDRYHLLFDGHTVVPDPVSLSQPEGVQGESQAFNVNLYHWKDKNWLSPLLKDYIIYELHTGTFSTGGDFQGVLANLDHLVDLGINAIEIMPVAQFPGERNWGYDGVFPFCVQNSYGGAAQLMELVDACHAKGIAVILDVVYNHFGPEGNYFDTFGPYFTDKYQTPWGKAINFDDAGCDGVREFFLENALMWFRDFHVDALRLDAVHAIKDLGARHILQDLADATQELGHQLGKSFQLIVECDLNDPKFLSPQESNGYGMQAQWIDEFHHALRVTAGEEPQGYFEDFDGIKALAKAYSDAYVYDGQYSKHREKQFGGSAKGLTGDRFIVFSQNHDQVGNRMLGERSSKLYSFEMLKLMAGAIFVSPFLPMLFMGEEWAVESPFLYFVSHSDPELIKAVREGRKAEFAAFHNGEAPDPESEETFLKSKLNWDALLEQHGQLTYTFYKKLIALRKSLPALNNSNREQLKVEVLTDKNCLVIVRREAGTSVFCFMNFSKTIQSIPVLEAVSRGVCLLDSAAPQWGGPIAASLNINKESTLTIQPESIVIYFNNHA